MSDGAGGETAGTQTLARAVAVLKHLGAAGAAGLRLVDVQERVGLTRPTVHRILKSLGEHGFTARDPSGRRYVLGPELAILARAAETHTLDLQKLCHPHIVELARETGDTAFLMVRSGFELVCVDLQTGAYPVKTMTANIGTRRPIGIGAAGVAVLAALGEDEAKEALKAASPHQREYEKANDAAIFATLQNARKIGYALSDGMVLGSVRGVSVAILDQREPVAALVVASIRERISAARLPAIGALLNKQKSVIERKLLQYRAQAAS